MSEEKEVFVPEVQPNKKNEIDPAILDLMHGKRPIPTKQHLDSVEGFHQKDKGYFFTDGSAVAEVIPVCDEIIRVRLAPQGTFLEDFSYAIQPYNFVPPHVQVRQTDEYYAVATPVVECRIHKDTFRISFEDVSTGICMNEDAHEGMHWMENMDFGGYYVFCTKRAQPNEHFYGLGDKATNFNLKGRRFTLWGLDNYAFDKHKDPLYKNIPFYIGLHHDMAYGLFYDNTFKSWFDFGTEHHEHTRYWAEGGELRYYYIHGPHMMDVVKRYSYLTGTHPMPPLWALGFHQSRWSYYPEKQVLDLAATFRKKKIPCDAIYLDIDYMDGYRCFTWNSKHFPDPARLVQDLDKDGFRLVVIIDPGIKIDENYWVFQEGKANRFFCRRADDYFMEGSVWPGKCHFPDFTNPKVRKWWGDLFEEFVEMGITGVWNDMNEPAVFGIETFPSDTRHHYDGHRGSHRKAHNVYGSQMARATYDGLRKYMKNRRPFVISRSGYSGAQRYACSWTGDNQSTWEHLQLANVMTQRLSISGMPFVGSDIGGFVGEPNAELFIRWIQFGVFSPLMRVHSAGDTRNREPWTYGEEAETIIRKFVELRYRLLPYMYSVFWEHHRYGFPIIRPIIMVEQKAITNHYREDEFTFGDKILVCPIVQPGVEGRVMYLPQGTWYDFWTNQPVKGGSELYVNAPLDKMPIFIKSGAVIPEYPVVQHTGELDIKELKINVYYADHEVRSFLYEDHGDTFAYEQGIYSEKKFTVTGDGGRVVMLQDTYGMFTPRYEHYDILLIGLPFVPIEMEADGQPLRFVPGEQAGTYRCRLSKSFKELKINS